MKIIDVEKKGNVVRFYLGEYDKEWGWLNKDYKDSQGNVPKWLLNKKGSRYWGDDWDDRPYEHNAGSVYPEYIKGIRDVSYDFDDLVLEPCDGEFNSPYSKEDMINRRVPCLIIVPKELIKDYWKDSFKDWIGVDGIKKYYFGDDEPSTIFDMI